MDLKFPRFARRTDAGQGRARWSRWLGVFNLNDPRWGRGEEGGSSEPKGEQPPRDQRPNGANQGPPDLDELWRDFNRRLNGAIDQVDLNNAYGDKRTYSKEDIVEKLGIDVSKKTVFVLAHAFSDAPHVGGTLAFDDYYDWLRQTLARLSANQDINVIVKPHPSSYMWGEKGAVEMLLEELGATNINITPGDFNTASIKNIADYIVTARGTAGLEYSGLGIPAITCGEGYYSGFDIAIEHLEPDSYFKALDNISSLSPLPENVSQRARVLLYLTFTKLARSTLAPSRHIYPGDDTAALIPQHYGEISANLSKRGLVRDKFMIEVEKAVDRAF